MPNESVDARITATKPGVLKFLNGGRETVFEHPIRNFSLNVDQLEVCEEATKEQDEACLIGPPTVRMLGRALVSLLPAHAAAGKKSPPNLPDHLASHGQELTQCDNLAARGRTLVRG